MLKAQQNQLAQSANIDLVNIRTAEIEYFVQFFTNFGTQCALIAGFQLSSICQVDTSGAARWSAYLYWISSALCICLSLHVLLCSVYSTVFGQGLALRGPTGSMVRAVDGMCAEQYEIIYIFSGNVFFLGCSTIATYYVVMDEYGAHVRRFFVNPADHSSRSVISHLWILVVLCCLYCRRALQSL